MPDGTGGVATGLYWVLRGKTPADDLQDKDDDEEEKPSKDDDEKDQYQQKPRK